MVVSPSMDPVRGLRARAEGRGDQAHQGEEDVHPTGHVDGMSRPATQGLSPNFLKLELRVSESAKDENRMNLQSWSPRGSGKNRGKQAALPAQHRCWHFQQRQHSPRDRAREKGVARTVVERVAVSSRTLRIRHKGTTSRLSVNSFRRRRNPDQNLCLARSLFLV